MAERVAFLGTGIIGAPMARNLLKAGFQVCVWNRTPEKARVLAADGAEVAETPADAVRDADAAFVITMLIDGAAVLAVIGQAAESVPDGGVWLQTGMDTDVERGSPRTTDQVRELSRDRHQGDGKAGPARRTRVRTRGRPSTGHSRSSTRWPRRPPGSSPRPVD